MTGIQIHSTMALTALKMCLGQLGRADFMTESKIWPGDLIYPDEKVTIFVLPCFWYGCVRHEKVSKKPWTPATRKKIRLNSSSMTKLATKLEKREWKLVRFFDCEVQRDPMEAAEHVQTVLESRRSYTGRTVAQMGPLDLAHLARLDAGSRVSDTSWRTFIRYVSELSTKVSSRAIKWEAEQYFTTEHGWSTAAFKEIWKCALHHEVIVPSEQGPTKGGPLIEACLVDCGFAPTGGKK